MSEEYQEIKDLYVGVRGTAVKILTRIERTDSYLDKLLDAEMRSYEWNPMDKRLLSEIVHGVLRNQSKLDWVLTGFYHGQYVKVVPNVRNALRVALYQILFLTRIPHHAAVNEAVEFVKKYRGQKLASTMNGLLRNIARNIENIRYPVAAQDELQYLSVVHSHPMWMVKRWHERYGFEGTESLCKANNIRPFLTLRVNKLRTSYNDFINSLAELAIDYRKCFYLDDFVTVRNLPSLLESKLYTEGHFSIQDESAGLVGKLLDPKPGETIIDLCAAPGGKATRSAEMMNNQGKIIAVDRYGTRLRALVGNAARLGVTIIEPMEADSLSLELEPVDKVLLDAPCSGLGVLSKKPDIKWKREPESIPELAKLQHNLLESAARLVKPGGVLVYSTCTIEPEENINQIKSFLEAHPEFTVDNASQYVQHQLVNADGCIETLPHKHRMDGTCAVRLVKTG